MTKNELRENVDRIRRELAEASEGRYPVPRLMAVTKTRGAEEILPLAEMGITEIGENRVQELKTKLPEIGDAFRIHLIGRLQRNKVRQIIGDVCMIHSVDRVELAEGIRVKGLMAVMPLTNDTAYLDGLFAGMRKLFEQMREASIPGVSMEELSMGMSGDYRLAARHGATVVRVGSAIFGPREERGRQ